MCMRSSWAVRRPACKPFIKPLAHCGLIKTACMQSARRSLVQRPVQVGIGTALASVFVALVHPPAAVQGSNPDPERPKP